MEVAALFSPSGSGSAASSYVISRTHELKRFHDLLIERAEVDLA
jgi:hypothetical protein